jgi:hypothetical protein
MCNLHFLHFLQFFEFVPFPLIAEQGLRLYRVGKMVMFSRSELTAFIKARAN